MAGKPDPKIFLSYAWANKDVADAIDDDFKKIGITFTRDVRDMPYRSSIKEFMQTVGDHDFVLMLISDEYLLSENCMYEATELLGSHQFRERILPIILDNARSIFSPFNREKYYDYWKELLIKAEKLNQEKARLDTVELVRKYRNIDTHLDAFFTDLTDLNSSHYDELKRQNYRPLLDVVGFDDKRLIEEVLGIINIRDKEEQEIALDRFSTENPKNFYGLFYKAWFAVERKEYRKAKNYYLNLLYTHPDSSDTHYNLAVLLAAQFADFENAKSHYEKAIMINQSHPDSHYNLAILLQKYFADFESAKLHYHNAIRINPELAEPHNNLAALLEDHFGDFNGAKVHYEQAVRIDPSNSKAQNNLAELIKKHFS